MLTANHSHPVSLAQAFHSCCSLYFPVYDQVCVWGGWGDSVPHLHPMAPAWTLNFRNLYTSAESSFLFLLLSLLSEGCSQRGDDYKRKSRTEAQPKGRKRQRSELFFRSDVIISSTQLSLLFSTWAGWEGNRLFCTQIPYFSKSTCSFLLKSMWNTS